MPLPTIRVLRDKREKHPLCFPKRIEHTDHTGKRKIFNVVEVPRNLKTGDYAIDGFEFAALVERKGSLLELQSNLFGDDKARAAAAFDRLAAETKNPYLLLDVTPSEVTTRNANCLWPDAVLDKFFVEMGRRGIRVLWFPVAKTLNQKYLQGALVLRILLAHANLAKLAAPRNPDDDPRSPTRNNPTALPCTGNV